VAGTSREELVSHAAELERRDAGVAAELDVLTDLAERAGSLRARAAEIHEALDRLPHELDEVARRQDDARGEVEAAQAELTRAEERVAALSRARRRKQDELDRAEREASTARDLRDDTRAEVERLAVRADALRASEHELHTEAETLAGAAKAIAAGLVRTRRIPEAPGIEPGDTLAELEEWGLLVRSAVLVARGTLEAERERIVVEANTLASGALGESLAASSVALVRRRLEELS
jgi:DNA repair exonuclease SbcCD ATPase subunit